MNQNHLLLQSNLKVFFSSFDNIQISSERSLKHKYVFLFLEIKHKFLNTCIHTCSLQFRILEFTVNLEAERINECSFLNSPSCQISAY